MSSLLFSRSVVFLLSTLPLIIWKRIAIFGPNDRSLRLKLALQAVLANVLIFCYYEGKTGCGDFITNSAFIYRDDQASSRRLPSHHFLLSSLHHDLVSFPHQGQVRAVQGSRGHHPHGWNYCYLQTLLPLPSR